MMNYIIKSVIGTTESGAQVEKSTATRPAVAIQIYKSHVERGLQPTIYKRADGMWEQIKLAQLIDEKSSEVKGNRCPYIVNIERGNR